MPNTKMTKGKWANHWHYNKLIYVVIVLAVVLGGDLIFSMTAYRVPNDRKVEIHLVDSYANTEFFEPFAQNALLEGQAFDEALEEVSFLSLAYNGSEDDVYGSQKYMVIIGAHEGHVFFLNRRLMEQLVYQGAALPLNDLIEKGILNPADWMDLSETTFHVTEDGDLSALGEQIYALPIGQLYKAMDEDIYFDVQDKYAVILTYAPNPETTAVVLQSVIDQLTGPKPQWMTQAPQEDAE